MQTSLRIFALLVIAIYFYVIFRFLKKKKIALKYTLLWLFSGLLMLVLVLFPQILIFVAKLLAIEVASNGLFGMCIFLIILILISLTIAISDLGEKEKRLVQNAALLDERIRYLEKLIKVYEEDKAKWGKKE